MDAVVWNWVESFLTDPAALEKGLADYKADRDAENEPLLERLKIVDDLLKQHNAELTEALQDLKELENRTTQRARARILDDIEQIEKVLDSLEGQRTGLVARCQRIVYQLSANALLTSVTGRSANASLTFVASRLVNGHNNCVI